MTFTPSQDASIYDEGTTNGAGQYLFSGVTRIGAIRRSLLQFDLSSLPAGATVSAASLTVQSSKGNGDARVTSLHRLTAAWSEGPSNPSANEGKGATAQTGDVTWNSANHPSTAWSTAGGDFEATQSSSTSVASTGSATFPSSATMVADVQGWASGTLPNYGWMLKDDTESGSQNAKRLNSRSSTSGRPTLTVVFTAPPPSPTSTPSGSPSPTPSTSFSSSVSDSASATPSVSASRSLSSSVSLSASVTPSNSPSISVSISLTPSPSATPSQLPAISAHLLDLVQTDGESTALPGSAAHPFPLTPPPTFSLVTASTGAPLGNLSSLTCTMTTLAPHALHGTVTAGLTTSGSLVFDDVTVEAAFGADVPLTVTCPWPVDGPVNTSYSVVIDTPTIALTSLTTVSGLQSSTLNVRSLAPPVSVQFFNASASSIGHCELTSPSTLFGTTSLTTTTASSNLVFSSTGISASDTITVTCDWAGQSLGVVGTVTATVDTPTFTPSSSWPSTTLFCTGAGGSSPLARAVVTAAIDTVHNLVQLDVAPVPPATLTSSPPTLHVGDLTTLSGWDVSTLPTSDDNVWEVDAAEMDALLRHNVYVSVPTSSGSARATLAVLPTHGVARLASTTTSMHGTATISAPTSSSSNFTVSLCHTVTGQTSAAVRSLSDGSLVCSLPLGCFTDFTCPVSLPTSPIVVSVSTSSLSPAVEGTVVFPSDFAYSPTPTFGARLSDATQDGYMAVFVSPDTSRAVVFGGWSPGSGSGSGWTGGLHGPAVPGEEGAMAVALPRSTSGFDGFVVSPWTSDLHADAGVSLVYGQVGPLRGSLFPGSATGGSEPVGGDRVWIPLSPASSFGFFFTVIGAAVKIEVHGGPSTAYRAWGVSPTGSMISTPSQTAVVRMADGTVTHRSLDARSPASIPVVSSPRVWDMASTSSSSFSFSRRLVTASNDVVAVDGSVASTVIWALGPTSGDFVFHSSGYGSHSVVFGASCDSASLCSGHGTCFADGNVTVGSCECGTGYSGLSCDGCARGFRAGAGGSCVAGSVSVELRFAVSTVLSTEAEAEAFVADLKADLSAVLGIPADRIVVSAADLVGTAPSDGIPITIGSSTEVSEPSVADVFDSLVSAVTDPSSELYDGSRSVTGDVLSSSDVTPTFVAPSPSPVPTFSPDTSVDLASDLTLAWQTHPTSITFRATLSRTAWVAIGWGSRMSGSTAVIAQPTAGTVLPHSISGRSQSSISALTSTTTPAITDVTLQQSGGSTVLTFTRPYDSTVFPAINPNASSTMVWAFGSGNTFQKHSSRGAVVVDLASGGTSAVDRDGQHVLHGALMFIAWGIWLPAGASMARFLKHIVPEDGQDPLWFRSHRVVQVVGLLVGMAGLVVAIDMVPDEHFGRSHSRLGLSVMVLGILQPINAAIRPPREPASTWRKVWQVWHKAGGYITLGLGFVALISGSNTIEPKASSVVRGLLIMWVVVWVVGWVVGSVVLCRRDVTNPARRLAKVPSEVVSKDEVQVEVTNKVWGHSI